MDPQTDATSPWTQSPAPTLPPFAEQAAPPEVLVKPLRLWFGMLLPPVCFLLAVMAISAGADAHTAYWVCMLPGFIFYFLPIRRFIVVLESQPGWNTEYTPAGVIWRQVIPLYGIYFIYVWTGDVEGYLKWRLGRVARVGLFAFLGILFGFLVARFFDVFMGQWIYLGSLYWLDLPLRRALKTPAPLDEMAPAYDGSLRLS